MILLFFYTFIIFCNTLFYPIFPGTCLPKQCQEWISSCRVDLKSNQILSDLLHKFYATITLAYFEGRTDFRSNVLQLDWCSHFFSDSLHSTFTHQRLYNMGGKANCRHKLDYPIINDVYCLQKWGSTVSFQRVTHCLRNSLSCFRGFHGTSQVNNLTECHPVLYWKPQLVMRNGQLRFCILIFRSSQQDSFNLFWAVSTALGFNFILPIALNSSCLFPHSLPLLYLSSSSSPDQCLYNPSFHKIYSSFLFPSLLYKSHLRFSKILLEASICVFYHYALTFNLNLSDDQNINMH